MPRKNLRLFAGVPMLVHSVRAARDSGLFEMVVVSTDDDEIARLAEREGAAVPFRRSAELADDHTPVSAVTVDALRRLDPDTCRFGAVAQLMPNCPLRTAEDVRAAYRAFESTEAQAQLSVTRFGWQNPWWAVILDRDGAMVPRFPEAITTRSQDLPPLFCPTGAIWWARAAVLHDTGTFHVASRQGWEMPWQRAIDIDTEEDLALAELVAGSALLGAGHG